MRRFVKRLQLPSSSVWTFLLFVALKQIGSLQAGMVKENPNEILRPAQVAKRMRTTPAPAFLPVPSPDPGSASASSSGSPTAAVTTEEAAPYPVDLSSGIGAPLSAWYFSLKTSKGYCGLVPAPAAAGGYGFVVTCGNKAPQYGSLFTLMLVPDTVRGEPSSPRSDSRSDLINDITKSGDDADGSSSGRDHDRTSSSGTGSSSSGDGSSGDISSTSKRRQLLLAGLRPVVAASGHWDGRKGAASRSIDPAVTTASVAANGGPCFADGSGANDARDSSSSSSVFDRVFLPMSALVGRGGSAGRPIVLRRTQAGAAQPESTATASATSAAPSEATSPSWSSPLAAASPAAAAAARGAAVRWDPSAPVLVAAGRPVRLLVRSAGLCNTPPVMPPPAPTPAPGPAHINATASGLGPRRGEAGQEAAGCGPRCEPPLAQRLTLRLATAVMAAARSTAAVTAAALLRAAHAACRTVASAWGCAACTPAADGVSNGTGGADSGGNIVPVFCGCSCRLMSRIETWLGRLAAAGLRGTPLLPGAGGGTAAVGDVPPVALICSVAQPSGLQFKLFKSDLKPGGDLDLSREWVYLMEGDKFCTVADVAGLTAALSCHLDSPGLWGYKFSFQTVALPGATLGSVLTGAPCGVVPASAPGPHDVECTASGREGGRTRAEEREAQVDLMLETPGSALAAGVSVGFSTFTPGLLGTEQQRCCAHTSSPHILICDPPGPGTVPGECWFNMYDVKITSRSRRSRSKSQRGDDVVLGRGNGDEMDVRQDREEAEEEEEKEAADAAATGVPPKGNGGASGGGGELPAWALTFLRSLQSELSPVGLDPDLDPEPRGPTSAEDGGDGRRRSQLSHPLSHQRQLQPEQQHRQQHTIPWLSSVWGSTVGAAAPLDDGSLVMLYSRTFGRYCSVSIDGTLLCVSAQASNASRNLFKLGIAPPPPPPLSSLPRATRHAGG